MSTSDKLKMSQLIARMLQIILGVQIEDADENLVNLYIKYVNRIDDNNPIKNLLLLKESFAFQFIRFVPEPDWRLSSYDVIRESEKERDEHNARVENDEDII